ncbi:DUF6049 family protein [Agrococcus sp. ProA11]|uniref:DUF6049 family protein n=1 Tax=Agrococcus chionoecetis TaxID=3153752 RepID=UPI003260C180
MLSAGRLAPRRATACAAVALATAVVAAPLLAPHAALATGQPDEVVAVAPTMRVAPLDPLLQDGEGLALEIEIENQATEATAPTTIEVLLTSAPIGTRYSLSRWFAGEAFLASSVVTSVEVPAIPGLERLRVQATVGAEELGLEGRTWGAYGVAASAGDLGDANTIIVRDAPGEAQPTTVALAAPIDAGIDETGLLGAEQLEAATGLGGDPRRALDAALGAGATVGIDPAFGTSIEALESDAPESAVDWLDRADTAATYPLLYGNADPLAQVRAGTFPLEPRGIPREDGDPLPASFGSIGQRQPVIDATKAIVQQEELATLADFGTVVLSTAMLDDTLQGATPSAHVSVDGVDVLAADAELQELVHAAGAADTLESSAVRAQIVALLATITRERPSDPRTLAAVLPATSSGDTAALLADLAEARFVETAGLDAALLVPQREASLATIDDPERGAGAELVSAALEQEAAVASIVSIVDEPTTLLAELRLALLAALPSAGRPVTDADRLATASLADSLNEVRTAVQIVGGSDIHAVGESVGLPITITNRLEVPANVVLTLRPTNALVSVDQPRVEVTVAPESQQRVQVPIDVVGTGTLWMIVQLHTPDGVPLGEMQRLRISAQPTIEVAVAWTIGAAIVLLLGFGIFRSIQKRRRGDARGDIDLAARSHDQTQSTTGTTGTTGATGTTEGTA